MKFTFNIKSIKVTEKGEINNVSILHEILPSEIKANVEMIKENLPQMINIVKKGMHIDQIESRKSRVKSLKERKNYYKGLIKEEDFSLFSKESIEKEISEINDELKFLGVEGENQNENDNSEESNKD